MREHGYDSELMRLYVVGGGGCMIKNFGEYDKRRVIIIETREKEDRFLQKILDTIQNGLNTAGNIGGVLKIFTANQEQPTKVEENTDLAEGSRKSHRP